MVPGEQSPISGASSVSVQTPTESTATPLSGAALQTYLQALLERNVDIVWHYFIFDTLATTFDGTNDPLSTIDGDWYPVISDKFSSFAQFHEYVASTYTQVETDTLFGPWQMGQALYKDVDGTFCSNANLGSGVITYVSWDGFTFTYELTSDTTISIDATVHEYLGEEGATPTVGPSTKLIQVHGTATLENGLWLLDHMMADGTFGE